MRIIARSTLRTFWDKYPDSEQPLKAWKERSILRFVAESIGHQKSLS